MKSTKILKILVLLFSIIILVSNVSFAVYSDVQMTVESEPVVRIDISENSYFEKRLISKDLENKEVTIQLSVVNNELPDKPTGELVLVIDNSNSMKKDKINNKTRSEVVRSSAQKFISNLLDGNNDLKIAIVSFSASTVVSEQGTDKDAELVHALSNNANELNSSIDNIADTGILTDLDSGITLGNQQFSGNSNQKYMVVLTDGVPNVALGHSNYPFDYQDVIDATKQKLQTISGNGVFLINMLTGVSDTATIPPGFTKNYGQIIQEIFGTSENPTVGEFFNISDSQIEETVTKKIVDKLTPVYKTLKDIKVKDVFPDYIVKNFDFSYVQKATHGDISASIDTSDNSITWTIPELKAGETATVQYKLKLKEGYDPSILDQLLNTNEEVDLTYTDFDGTSKSKTTKESPQLKLTEPKVVATPTPAPAAPAVSPIPLPAAGTIGVIGAIIITAVIAIILLIKNHSFKDIK